MPVAIAKVIIITAIIVVTTATITATVITATITAVVTAIIIAGLVIIIIGAAPELAVVIKLTRLAVTFAARSSPILATIIIKFTAESYLALITPSAFIAFDIITTTVVQTAVSIIAILIITERART